MVPVDVLDQRKTIALKYGYAFRKLDVIHNILISSLSKADFFFNRTFKTMQLKVLYLIKSFGLEVWGNWAFFKSSFKTHPRFPQPPPLLLDNM